jgi:hypothetical protein
MVEAETLAEKGKLNSASEKKINALLANHVKALDNALNKIDNTKSKDKADKIITNFNDKMNAHAKILDNILAKDNFDKTNNNNLKNSNKSKDNF